MSFRNTSSTRWRGRAIAVAGIAAAATVGGLALATAAEAVTPTTVTWTAPSQVTNDGFAGDATIVVNNSAAGTSAIDGIEIDVTGPTSLVCTSLHITGAIAFTFTGANGSCVGVGTPAPTIASGAAAVTYNESVSVTQPGLTGTLTSSVHVLSGTTTVGTSAAQTTNIVAPTAPAFNTAAVPPATIYHPYTYQLTSTQGFPAAVVDTGYAYAFGTHKNSDGTYSCTARGTNFGFVNNDTDKHYYITLSGNPNNGYVFDVTTGQLRSLGTPSQTNSVRYFTWTIVENNGEGGATALTAGTACNTTAVPTPTLAVHDVTSNPFSVPVLFSDVQSGAPFFTEIYDLSDSNSQIIRGYADGTFRPGAAVTRQAFAAYIARELGVGEAASPVVQCSPLNGGSGFSDVPSNSPFCEDIRDLAKLGIINGYSNGSFHPGANITRQAVAAILYRAHAYNVGATVGDAVCTSAPFSDVSTSNPFCGDIAWMKAQGYANGYSDGGFHPTSNVTRQATAAFIDRIF